MATTRKPKPTPEVFTDDVWTSKDQRDTGRSYRLVNKANPQAYVAVSDPITERNVLPIQFKRFVPNSMGYRLVCRVGDVYQTNESTLRYEGRKTTTEAWVRRLNADDGPRFAIDYADLVKLTLVTRGTGKVE